MNAVALPFRPTWLATVGPLLPALVLLACTASMEAWQSPDSVKYLLAAERLARGEGFSADFVHWPPLYPALLALHPSLSWAALLGNLGAVATVTGLWAIGRKIVAPVSLGVMLLALACLPQFQTVFGMVWSEALYVPLCVWLAYFWTDHLTTGSRRTLLAACALLALALLTRHVGVVLVVAMALMSFRRPATLVLVGAACIPYALWVARTFLVSGTYAGERPPLADPDLLRQVELFGRTVGHWFVPHVHFLSGGVVMAAVFLAAALAALDYHHRRSPLLTFAALFVLGHGVLTIYTASRVFLDVDARTLFPIFWPTLLLVVCAVESARAPSRWYYYPVSALVLLWFSSPNAITNALA